jgi:Putative DNA-binding domain
MFVSQPNSGETMTTWDLAELQRHIIDRVEESHTLEYKDARAIGDSDKQKSDINKDVSAMANAAGGVLI